ncbi:endonuclease Q family protein [Bacillaceae bacterium W0354]
MTFNTYYADLHIHIGRTMYGAPVKITASNHLTMTNIFHYVEDKKGIDLVGVIDSHVPQVIEEIVQLVDKGTCYELPDGGVSNGNVTLILGSEIEIYDDHCSGPIHVLCFLPTIDTMRQFAKWYRDYVKNPTLSSQRMYIDAQSLQKKVKELDGLFIPAHVFTPFKSMYGKGVKESLNEVFIPELIDAVELGLSSDTSMAETIAELNSYTFLTNSDAHSLEKIGREYQALQLQAPTFLELKKALSETEGRKIIANYGMNPKLGKYYTTICRNCHEPLNKKVPICPNCGSNQIVKGVSERIKELKQSDGALRIRPPYIHQVPLEYIPGLGPKTLAKLRETLKHDMYIIHEATSEQLIAASNDVIAKRIIQLRKGELLIHPGGGGTYGKIIT